MDSASATYFVVIDGAVSGPHTLTALQQMASVHAFDENAQITPASSEAWQAVRENQELHAALFPAAKKLGFKPRDFAKASDSSTPITVEEILRENIAAPDRFELPPQRKPSMSLRTRDYLIALVLCNGAGIFLYAFLPMNLFIGALLASYFVMVNCGLYWVYFHIMSRH